MSNLDETFWESHDIAGLFGGPLGLVKNYRHYIAETIQEKTIKTRTPRNTWNHERYSYIETTNAAPLKHFVKELMYN